MYYGMDSVMEKHYNKEKEPFRAVKGEDMFTILVCDDDKEIVEAVDIYLSQEGYRILKAYDGEEAIRILKENEVYLIILDIMMPNLDGMRAT